jgi:uncharacterized protein (TIGR02118 family)
MIVITFLLRRAPGMTADEFHRYWRQRHGPLVAGHAAVLGIRRYSQLHTTASPMGAPIAESRGCEPADYDGIALVWFDSEESLAASASTPEGVTAAAALLEDERRFLDLPRCQLWISDDHPLVG